LDITGVEMVDGIVMGRERAHTIEGTGEITTSKDYNLPYRFPKEGWDIKIEKGSNNEEIGRDTYNTNSQNGIPGIFACGAKVQSWGDDKKEFCPLEEDLKNLQHNIIFNDNCFTLPESHYYIYSPS
jgi:hypothetical protein